MTRSDVTLIYQSIIVAITVTTFILLLLSYQIGSN